MFVLPTRQDTGMVINTLHYDDIFSDLPKSKICNIGGILYVQKISSTDVGPRIDNNLSGI